MADTSAPAAPAQPTAPLDATAALEAMSPAERQTWRETGTVPERPAVTADPADADDDEPAMATVAATVAEVPPAAPAGKPLSKRQQQINDLERRAKAAELDAQELRAQLARGSQPAPTPDTGPTYDGLDPADPKPKMEAFVGKDDDPYMQLADGDAYLASALAIKDWKDRRDARAAQFRTQQTAAQTAGQQRAETYTQRMVTYGASKPEFTAKVRPVLDSIDPSSPMAAWLTGSPVAAQMAEHWADHPEDFTRIARAASLEDASRAFYRLEARFDSDPSLAAAAPAAVAPKTETSAPAPPTVLTSRGTASADPVAAAIRDKDPGRYIREQNARELAAMTRR